MIPALDDGFGRIHHGFLNNLDWLRALTTHVGMDEYVEIAEGDVCWLVEGGEVQLFFMHPSLTYRLPKPAEIRAAIARGELPTLEDVLASEFSALPLIVELKTGHGSRRQALAKLLSELEDKAAGRYWIDTFHPGHLALVKELSPKSPTSLHSRLGVYGRRIWRTTYEFPNVSLMNLYRLPQVDAVTITYKNSPALLFRSVGATIDGVHKHVHLAGKELVFGGIQSEVGFQAVARSKARAAYMKWDKKKFSTPRC